MPRWETRLSPHSNDAPTLEHAAGSRLSAGSETFVGKCPTGWIEEEHRKLMSFVTYDFESSAEG